MARALKVSERDSKVWGDIFDKILGASCSPHFLADGAKECQRWVKPLGSRNKKRIFGKPAPILQTQQGTYAGHKVLFLGGGVGVTRIIGSFFGGWGNPNPLVTLPVALASSDCDLANNKTLIETRDPKHSHSQRQYFSKDVTPPCYKYMVVDQLARSQNDHEEGNPIFSLVGLQEP